MASERLRHSIMRHEGEVRNADGLHEAYDDGFGNLTIGYGTLLDERLTIGDDVAFALLDAELREKEARLLEVTGWAESGPTRRAVLTEMAYWLGVRGCLRFRRMWECVRAKDWAGAAAEMRDSTAWRDERTRGRMETLAVRMESGKWEGGDA